MPIYEFVCRDCGAEFEQLMSFSAHGQPPCPACAGEHVNRRLGRPAIHFKGSGWYVTDSKGSKQSANGDGGARTGEKDDAGEKVPAKDAGRDSGKDASRDSGRDSGRDSDGESRKVADKGAGKPASGGGETSKSEAVPASSPKVERSASA